MHKKDFVLLPADELIASGVCPQLAVGTRGAVWVGASAKSRKYSRLAGR